MKKTSFSYPRLPEKHRSYFEKHAIPLNQSTYPEMMLSALHSLNEAILSQKAIGAGVSEGEKLRNGKNIAFWQFLDGIPISESSGYFLKQLQQPNDLGVFCSKNCKGILNTAINGIDKLVRIATTEADKSLNSLPNYQFSIFVQIKELIDTGLFEWPEDIDDFPLPSTKENTDLINKLLSNNLLVDELDEYKKRLLQIDNLESARKDLQESSSFIRDVATLVSRSKTQDNRPHERRKNTQPQKPLRPLKELDPALETDSARILTRISSLESSTTSIHRKQKPLYPQRKNTPSPLLSGFCLICHRPSSHQEYYCYLHTKPRNGEERPDLNKGRKKIINQAFDNLGYLLIHEKTALLWYPRTLNKCASLDKDPAEIRKGLLKNHKSSVKNYQSRWNLTDKEIFVQKSYFLAGWGMHHPQHRAFYNNLAKIECEHITDSKSWSTNTLGILNKIILLAKQHNHTQDIFPPDIGLLQCSNSELNSLHEIQNKILGGGIDELLSPADFLECINRLSIYRLIETASNKRKYKTVINEDYRPDDLIRSSI